LCRKHKITSYSWKYTASMSQHLWNVTINLPVLNMRSLTFKHCCLCTAFITQSFSCSCFFIKRNIVMETFSLNRNYYDKL
jgi:hypothetical protein